MVVLAETAVEQLGVKVVVMEVTIEEVMVLLLVTELEPIVVNESASVESALRLLLVLLSTVNFALFGWDDEVEEEDNEEEEEEMEVAFCSRSLSRGHEEEEEEISVWERFCLGGAEGLLLLPPLLTAVAYFFTAKWSPEETNKRKK